jgi:hypothetical protein
MAPKNIHAQTNKQKKAPKENAVGRWGGGGHQKSNKIFVQTFSS